MDPPNPHCVYFAGILDSPVPWFDTSGLETSLRVKVLDALVHVRAERYHPRQVRRQRTQEGSNKSNGM